LLCYLSLDFLFPDSPIILTLAKRILLVVLALGMVRVLDAFLKTMGDIHASSSQALTQPIRS
jgi:hypothetical protein